jgi:hypothetical protein
MSLTLAIAIVLVLDVALLAGLSYVMSRTQLLTPHVSDHTGHAAQPIAGHSAAATTATKPVHTRASRRRVGGYTIEASARS